MDVITLRKCLELGNLLLAELDSIFFESHLGEEIVTIVTCVGVGGHAVGIALYLVFHDNVISSNGTILFQFLTANLIALLVIGDISDHIDIGPVHILQRALVRIHANAHSPVDSCDFNTIARPDMVDQVLIRAQMNRLRCLTLWHTLRSLLDFDVLFVGEDARVEVGLEGIALLTVDTVGRLKDATHLDRPLLLAEALGASEVRLFHLGHDVAVADDNAAERDQLLDVVRAELADAIHFAKVVRAHLDDLVVAKLVIVHIVVSIVLVLPTDVVHVELLEHLRDHQIEDRDDIRRVVLNLPVQHLIELEHMVTVDLQDVAIELAHLLELLDVVGRFLILLIVLIIVVVLDLLKVVDEVFEFHLDLGSVDICAPKHHCVRAHFCGAHASLQEVLTWMTLIVHHACGRGLVISELNLLLSARRVEHWLIQESVDIKETALLLEVRHQCRRMQDSKAKERKVKEM